MFTNDNTFGYTEIQLAAFNVELVEKLKGVEPFTDNWYSIEAEFSNEVANR